MWGYHGGDLFEDFERMRRQMDELFGGAIGPSGIRSAAAGAFPAINVGTSADQVDVFLFAAGCDPESLDVSLQQNLLTVAGERKADIPEGAQVYRSERFGGSFRRVITLPDDVDPEKVNASYRDGILRVTVQRREAVKPRQIQVH